jgi:hypothetical protein
MTSFEHRLVFVGDWVEFSRVAMKGAETVLRAKKN